jgi:hypothetical protein
VTWLAAAALLPAAAGQSMEQLAPPSSRAAALRVDQPHAEADDPARVSQLPPQARVVAQPAPRPTPVDGDPAIDAARAYAAILGFTPRNNADGSSIARAAAAAGLVPAGMARTPAAPKRGK